MGIEHVFEMEPENNKLKTLLIVILVVVATVSSLSVTGLLQSTEKFITSGVVVRPPPPIVTGGGGSPSHPPSPPPPEPVVEIDVYIDSNCTQKVTEVTWGVIFSGNSKSTTIFVKNKGDTRVVLSLITENWTPSNAANFMSLTWNDDGLPISAGKIKELVLTLKIDKDCPEISGFSFDIVIVAS